MPKGHNTPSLYEMLSGNFSGGLSLNQVSEQNQVILSVLDNMQRVLNCRAGTLAHLPDYGLPDMTKILQGMPGTAHQLITTLSVVLLKYEPRLSRINVVMQEQIQPGELRYAIDAEPEGGGAGALRHGIYARGQGINPSSETTAIPRCTSRHLVITQVKTVMTINSERQLKTGGDPRTLADYAALRDEMNKLTHPARPDVNWQHAETLCLSLFEHNGVELQTAAWYTLARTHLAGLYGMNEGLALLAALVVRQWGSLW